MCIDSPGGNRISSKRTMFELYQVRNAIVAASPVTNSDSRSNRDSAATLEIQFVDIYYEQGLEALRAFEVIEHFADNCGPLVILNVQCSESTAKRS